MASTSDGFYSIRVATWNDTTFYYKNVFVDNSKVRGPNGSANGSEKSSDHMPFSPHNPLGHMVAIALVLSTITLLCLVGNLLVMIAVGLVKKLRTPSNYLIANLAVADWLVGLLVMPWAIVYDVLGWWPFGAELCSMWMTCDVLLSTASILNLMMISVDRYLIIMRPLHYSQKRTGKLMLLYICLAWIVSLVIGVAPLVVGWKPVTLDGICLVSQELGYQVYATIGAFYLPLSVMVALYGKVLYVSTRIAKTELRNSPGRVISEICVSSNDLEMQQPLKSDNNNFERDVACGIDGAEVCAVSVTHYNKASSSPWQEKSERSGSCGKPSKAITTLGVIMGGFIAFWLPFFVLALIRPFCTESCQIPNWVQSVLTWLGYVNSCLNPIVYIRFNREYRTPFKEILLLRCRTLNVAVRRAEYKYQFGSVKRSSKPNSYT